MASLLRIFIFVVWGISIIALANILLTEIIPRQESTAIFKAPGTDGRNYPSQRKYVYVSAPAAVTVPAHEHSTAWKHIMGGLVAHSLPEKNIFPAIEFIRSVSNEAERLDAVDALIGQIKDHAAKPESGSSQPAATTQLSDYDECRYLRTVQKYLESQSPSEQRLSVYDTLAQRYAELQDQKDSYAVHLVMVEELKQISTPKPVAPELPWYETPSWWDQILLGEHFKGVRLGLLTVFAFFLRPTSQRVANGFAIRMLGKPPEQPEDSESAEKPSRKTPAITQADVG